jgi:nucleoside-diphosphate-sugar epimerase
MTISRREFLGSSAAAGALSMALPLRPPTNAMTQRLAGAAGSVRQPLRILILGGTTFLGPHQIRYALERGHSVSTFTRGQTEPTINQELFRDVEQLIGDRENDLTALHGRRWDAVIDNSGRSIEWTRRSADLLRDSVGLYVYTSSTGVYYPYLGDDITEDTVLVMEDPPSDPPRENPSYGVMKANSELVARQIFGDDRTIVVRPTYIVGPADPSNRFPYWPARLELGGEVLVPGHEDDPVQYIDVRDLTEFMIRLIEDRAAGTYNVAGPAAALGMHPFVYGASAAFSKETWFVDVTDYEFLVEHGPRFAIPWIMPRGDYVGSARINIQRAKGAGLSYRPLARTCWDTIQWWHSDAVSEERRELAWSGQQGSFPLTMDREREIIAAWRARSG